jgi:hypothetical protein
MNKKVSYLVVVFCALFAGQILADNVYLPTVIYRDAGSLKVEFIYNNDGYIISGKLYKQVGENNDYILQHTELYDFHKLSNGEFVQTKMERESYRTTSAYDSRDMLLWQQSEYLDGSTWVLGGRTEAVLNDNGIRTGVRKKNWDTGQMEIVPGYTFDNQGRLVRSEFLSGENGDVPYLYTATWGSGKVYTGHSYSSGAESIVYQNIVAVHNEEYFNPYDLVGSSEDFFAGGAFNILLQPAYTDYEMHHVFYNEEMVYAGTTYVQQIVKDDANNEISEIIKLGATEIAKTVYKQLANGGWSKTEYEMGVVTFQTTKEYDSHGLLIREYRIGTDDGGKFEYETTYVIEYDTQGRPTKCTKTRTETETGYAHVEGETYTEWVVKGSTGIESIATSSLSVYPNPATDYIVIDNIFAGTDITISDVSGRTVYKQTAAGNKETLSVASLAKGIYLLTLQTGNNKSVGKIIKK